MATHRSTDTGPVKLCRVAYGSILFACVVCPLVAVPLLFDLGLIPSLTCSILALVLGVSYAKWPVVFLCLLSIMTNLGSANLGIYSGFTDYQQLWPIRYGGLLLAGSWYVVSRRSELSFRRTPLSRRARLSEDVWFTRFIALAVITGALGSVMQFRDGVPLFQDQVDVARQLARENTNIIVGVLQQGWTIGLLLCCGVLLFEKNRSPKILCLLVYFLLGSALGGSRNSILSGIVPVGIAWLTWKRADGPRLQRSRNMEIKASLVILIGLIVVVLAMEYSAQRVLAGTGVFETEFQNSVGQGRNGTLLQMTILTFTAPIETWVRLDTLTQVGSIPFGFQTMAWAGSVLALFDIYPSMNEIASGVSSPYYMNAATFGGAPLVDFGRVGVIATGLAIGIIAGLIIKFALRHNDLPLFLLYGHVIYIVLLGLYSFQPFNSVGPFVIGLSLFILHSKVGRPIRAESEKHCQKDNTISSTLVDPEELQSDTSCAVHIAEKDY